MIGHNIIFISPIPLQFLVVSFRSGYSYLCQPIDYSYPTDDLSLRVSAPINSDCHHNLSQKDSYLQFPSFQMARANFLFFFSKIIELADTVSILVFRNHWVISYHVAWQFIIWFPDMLSHFWVLSMIASFITLGYFHPSKKEQSSDFPPCLASHRNGDQLVDGSQVLYHWPMWVAHE